MLLAAIQQDAHNRRPIMVVRVRIHFCHESCPSFFEKFQLQPREIQRLNGDLQDGE